MDQSDGESSANQAHGRETPVDMIVENPGPWTISDEPQSGGAHQPSWISSRRIGFAYTVQGWVDCGVIRSVDITTFDDLEPADVGVFRVPPPSNPPSLNPSSEPRLNSSLAMW